MVWEKTGYLSIVNNYYGTDDSTSIHDSHECENYEWFLNILKTINGENK